MHLLAASTLAFGPAPTARPPNVVIFLADDQDYVLGGSGLPMPKTTTLLRDRGVEATSFYAHTPVCCPSRAETLTGRYFHNLKVDPETMAQLPKSEFCMNINGSKVNNNSLARRLREDAGYETGMFGKWLNRDPGYVPLGWSAWFGNNGGTYVMGSPKAAFRVSGLHGVSLYGQDLGATDGFWVGNPSHYSTAVIGNVTVAWIRHVVRKNRAPFFAYVAPKAPHEPFVPAPWYLDSWHDTWPEFEPRPASWNVSGVAHHGVVANNPPLTEGVAETVTGIFKNRWRTILSIDDLVAGVVDECTALGVAEQTFFIYSSDNGFHLGEFRMPFDKQHVYETDARVPLTVRGPGVAAGSRIDSYLTNVDLAPTILEIAGLFAPDPLMDGRSFLPLITDRGAESERALATWRRAVFIEYYTSDAFSQCFRGCTGVGAYPQTDSRCIDLKATPNEMCWSEDAYSWYGPLCSDECYPIQSESNNYIALRGSTAGRSNVLYAEFQTGSQRTADVNFSSPDFRELYDMDTDPWSMNNLVYGPHAQAGAIGEVPQLHAALMAWYSCAGKDCWDL